MASSKSNKPVAQFRARSVSASVFVNSSKENDWYSIVVQRVYNKGTDKKPELENTNSFNENDLHLVTYVVQKAQEYCIEHKLNTKED